MYGHYFLSYGDRYVYNAHDFSVNIAMNSYKTRNFQCIRNLNKLGFYQAARAIMPSVRYHKDQYNHHVLFASEKGTWGPLLTQSFPLNARLRPTFWLSLRWKVRLQYYRRGAWQCIHGLLQCARERCSLSCSLPHRIYLTKGFMWRRWPLVAQDSVILRQTWL